MCPYFATDQPAGTPKWSQGSARCLASELSYPVTAQHQVVFCLVARYIECSRYRPAAGVTVVSGHGRRHGLLSGLAVLASVAVGTALSFAVIGNPLAVEPDASSSSTMLAGTATSSTSAAGEAAPSPALEIPKIPTSAPSTPSPTPQVVTVTATPAATPIGTAYTVQPGDTLAALAVRFHVSIAALVAANNLASTDRLLVGQVLRIPPAESASPPAR